MPAALWGSPEALKSDERGAVAMLCPVTPRAVAITTMTGPPPHISRPVGSPAGWITELCGSDLAHGAWVEHHSFRLTGETAVGDDVECLDIAKM